ncbi:TetR/AcrR family transcriptional regulator [Amycolatopsis nigrescens]|uniref:TetR/AcrR family transcriptional regulator n=1 Tax=Amycolatopsis nigrescens TaxID=381445 RepID=UPI00036B04AD|nr:TetR/AcrR family transcriptional regulator [Amycolatopsis nigrescens]
MPTEPRPLRRDARRNRELLIAAAREIFGSKGLDAPLDEVARRAGVAIGTLYNRFPTRIELVEAAFSDLFDQAAAIAEEAAAIEDPWQAFVFFLERTCELQAMDRGYAELCTRPLPDAPLLEAGKTRSVQVLSGIIDRAKEAGRLRADFRLEDAALAFTGTTGTATYGVEPEAWRRHLAFLLDGFRAENAHPLP